MSCGSVSLDRNTAEHREWLLVASVNRSMRLWGKLATIGMFCVFAGACIGDETRYSMIEKAERALAAKEFAEAAELAAKIAEMDTADPRLQQRMAEILFLSGKPTESLPLFDRVVKLLPQSAPDNWQRGIALCCVGKFADGERQFATHHEVNPDDVENSAWHFLCVAKTKSIAAARKSVIGSRGDSREPMMSVLKMLKGEIAPEKVLEAAVANTTEGASRRTANFYGSLYVALYFDSIGETEKAIAEFKRCVALGEQGYMADTARVYLASRFPNNGSTASTGKK